MVTIRQAGKKQNCQQFKSRFFLIRYKLLHRRSPLANKFTSNEIRSQHGRLSPFSLVSQTASFERSARGAAAPCRVSRKISLYVNFHRQTARNCKNACVSVFPCLLKLLLSAIL